MNRTPEWTSGAWQIRTTESCLRAEDVVGLSSDERTPRRSHKQDRNAVLKKADLRTVSYFGWRPRLVNPQILPQLSDDIRATRSADQLVPETETRELKRLLLWFRSGFTDIRQKPNWVSLFWSFKQFWTHNQTFYFSFLPKRDHTARQTHTRHLICSSTSCFITCDVNK